jgi:iron complex outermembrane receptor protein
MACLVLSLATVSWPAHAESVQEEKGVDLTSVSIEDLMNMTVTSVSRTEQTIANAAAAVFVITSEDIRRSGVTSIPEALRMVPGLEVARIDANKWAISSRGFNGRFASKMLVQIDGRTVYTSLFSGVFWDAQDTVLEDIERIEVIRGPGATLWGANAVNGIINIITKDAGDTKGGLLSAGGGTMERAFGTARYGTQLGSSSALRFYVKYLDRAGMDDLQTGHEAHNGWNSVRGGFRLDSEPSSSDTLTLQGDYYDERLNETYVNQTPNSIFDYTTPSSGGNLLARWKRAFSDTDDLTLQLYYDRIEMRYAVIDEQRDTVDIDFQNRFAFGALQEIIWGAGYRFSHDRTQFPFPTLNLGPGIEDNHLFSFFVQDSIALVPDQLNLIIGSKFEHNDYTGFEVQPNARLIWTPTRQQCRSGSQSPERSGHHPEARSTCLLPLPVHW